MHRSGARTARWPRRLLLSTAMGFAFTIALTWACAIWSPLRKSVFHKPESADASWRVQVPDGWTIRTWLESHGPGIEHHLVSECVWVGSTLGTSSSFPTQRTMFRIHCGFPFAAGVFSIKDDTNRSTPASAWLEFGIPVQDLQFFGKPTLITGEPRHLPLRVIPHLFAANIAIWSLVSLLLLTGFNAIRSDRRRRHKLCISCGYPRAGADTCPECGQPSSPQRGARL